MTNTKISEFRKTVYQSLKRRADILFDLIDALTVAGQVSSPVALSEQKLFRRKFGSVYDGLENGEMDMGEILSLLPGAVNRFQKMADLPPEKEYLQIRRSYSTPIGNLLQRT